MWYKKHEIINTGRGYIIQYGHYDDYNNDLDDKCVKNRIIYTHTMVNYVNGFNEPTIKKLSLNYYIPQDLNFLYSDLVHFDCVETCEKYIDEITKSTSNDTRIDDYSKKYIF